MAIEAKEAQTILLTSESLADEADEISFRTDAELVHQSGRSYWRFRLARPGRQGEFVYDVEADSGAVQCVLAPAGATPPGSSAKADPVSAQPDGAASSWREVTVLGAAISLIVIGLVVAASLRRRLN
ncbi:MAG: hypothetical protein GF320_02255 [Armatimonadia bacterium]|nr:hypothetical protein [Armatimonadia bacterium]